MATKITAPVRIDISGGWPDSDPYRKDFGGCVLNAAINQRVYAEFKDAELTSSLVNVRAVGLGASGAVRSAIVVASNPYLLNNKIELVRKVHTFENLVLEQRAGFQDEAAAIYGGVNYWEFGTNGSIKKVPIPKAEAKHLEQKIVLIDTGDSHLSADIHASVFGPGNYERNIPALDRMKEIAGEMKKYVGNQTMMAKLIEETWRLQRSLHDSIETDLMRKLQEKLNGRYLACRATGAGGGGCMMFYTDSQEKFTSRYKEIQEQFGGTKLMPFRFDYEGIRIEH